MDNPQSRCNPGDNGLTRAEAAVLALVDAGLSNQEIALRLSISVGTVKCHLHRVYDKFQVRNRTQAALRAREFDQRATTAGRETLTPAR